MRFPPPLAGIVIASAIAVGTAHAALSGVSPSGFVVTYKADIDVAPDVAYQAFGQVQRWWSPQHTYSGNADNLRVRLTAGGCFCETWEQGSVEHARVIYALRDRAVRMQGAFGPLQEMAVNAVLELRVAPRKGGSTFTMTYRVRGSPDAALDKLSAPVDGVMVEQARRLLAYVDATAAKVPRPGEETFDAGGVRLHYIELGRGEPVILLHDLGTSAEETWGASGAMAALAQGFHAIALDFPGHGGSDRPSEPARYGRALGEDVLRLMEHLKLARAQLVGYGLGAQVAAWLAVHHPDRFQAVVLAGGGPLREGAPNGGAAAWPGAAVMPELVVSDGELARITLPTLGVAGKLDPGLGELVALRAVMPRPPQLAAIEQATHASAPSSPDLASAIAQFLRSHPLR
ncbi:MAG TPA: alpha/beta hydrolase [Usitatibacter sp.]|nr:alpha/beta hydrolase [Usitatibacter sp.]